MGLDQYLFRLTGEDGRDEVAYWRKANHVHNWFIEYCAGGNHELNVTDIEVSLEQLAGLRKTCQEVLDNPTTASVKLPTRSGFFFGGTDYDEWYFADLKDTVELLDKVLASAKDYPEARYVYWTWW